MKKLYPILLSMALLFSFAACSGSQPASSENAPSEVPASSSEISSQPAAAASETAAAPEDPSASENSVKPEEPSSTGEPAEPEEPAGAGGTLIAYFSWSGNTRQLAQFIQAETGGDLFTIEPATPYTDDYNTLLEVAQQEQAENARPELAAQVENWDSYEVVFVGYPDWWSDAPMPVYSFLESYDWTGKTLVPFCTSGGSGFGRSLDKLPDSVPGAAILEGLHINGDRVDGAAGDVAAWIDSLGL